VNIRDWLGFGKQNLGREAGWLADGNDKLLSAGRAVDGKGQIFNAMIRFHVECPWLDIVDTGFRYKNYMKYILLLRYSFAIMVKVVYYESATHCAIKH